MIKGASKIITSKELVIPYDGYRARSDGTGLPSDVKKRPTPPSNALFFSATRKHNSDHRMYPELSPTHQITDYLFCLLRMQELGRKMFSADTGNYRSVMAELDPLVVDFLYAGAHSLPFKGFKKVEKESQHKSRAITGVYLSLDTGDVDYIPYAAFAPYSTLAELGYHMPGRAFVTAVPSPILCRQELLKPLDGPLGTGPYPSMMAMPVTAISPKLLLRHKDMSIPKWLDI
ncbi:hypothetical protein B0H11DRAFT_1921350 [Mycena galericulata]|nr:hypothetical protein B0H11DRAFT_1921350 [Mycena galericulata]